MTRAHSLLAAAVKESICKSRRRFLTRVAVQSDNSRLALLESSISGSFDKKATTLTVVAFLVCEPAIYSMPPHLNSSPPGTSVAPPPVEMCVMRSATPALLIAATESPPLHRPSTQFTPCPGMKTKKTTLISTMKRSESNGCEPSICKSPANRFTQNSQLRLNRFVAELTSFITSEKDYPSRFLV